MSDGIYLETAELLTNAKADLYAYSVSIMWLLPVILSRHHRVQDNLSDMYISDISFRSFPWPKSQWLNRPSATVRSLPRAEHIHVELSYVFSSQWKTCCQMTVERWTRSAAESTVNSRPKPAYCTKDDSKILAESTAVNVLAMVYERCS